MRVCVCFLLKTKTNQHTLYIAMFQSLLLCNLETTSFVLERYVQYHLTARCWLVCGLIHEGGLAWTSIVNSKQSIESTHTHTFAWCVFSPTGNALVTLGIYREYVYVFGVP